MKVITEIKLILSLDHGKDPLVSVPPRVIGRPNTVISFPK